MIKYVLWFYALCSKCHNDLVYNYAIPYERPSMSLVDVCSNIQVIFNVLIYDKTNVSI